jgi:hypothetical protein
MAWLDDPLGALQVVDAGGAYSRRPTKSGCGGMTCGQMTRELARAAARIVELEELLKQHPSQTGPVAEKYWIEWANLKRRVQELMDKMAVCC